jgi:hypothetical protein
LKWRDIVPARVGKQLQGKDFSGGDSMTPSVLGGQTVWRVKPVNRMRERVSFGEMSLMMVPLGSTAAWHAASDAMLRLFH